mgnify:FL=1
MKRALLLINGGARQTKELREKIAPALRNVGLDLIETSESNPGHFAELINRFADKIDMVITAGGDGTSLCAAKALLGKAIPLGVIPLGTANNLARTLEIPLTIEGAAQVIGHGHSQKVDVAQVNGNPFLNVSGMGLSTQVNKIVPANHKKRWGLWAYVAYSFSFLHRTKYFKAKVECNGETHSFKSRQITICNGKFYGSGISIAPDASANDGLLDLFSAHFTSGWRVFSLIPLYLLKKHSPDKGLHLLRAPRFTITTVPQINLDTDGEVTSQTPATYEVLNERLTIFTPKPLDKQK